MAYRWENVTEKMRVHVNPSNNGIEIVTYFKDLAKDECIELFFIDSDNIYPVDRKKSVHTRYEYNRRYAYLLLRSSGNLGELLDRVEFRLSVPQCIPVNDFSFLTKMVLERKVKAPEWEEVTSQCKPILVKSHSSPGFYVRLMHKGNLVALLGHHRNGIIMAERTNGRYKIELAKNATISFQVYKKNRA